jgi:hypothetical protein
MRKLSREMEITVVQLWREIIYNQLHFQERYYVAYRGIHASVARLLKRLTAANPKP